MTTIFHVHMNGGVVVDVEAKDVHITVDPETQSVEAIEFVEPVTLVPFIRPFSILAVTA